MSFQDRTRDRIARSDARLFKTRGKVLGVKTADLDRMMILGASARVETGADVYNRVTLTRLATLGLFAFALRKETGHIYITFDLAEGTVHAAKLEAKHEAAARKWAAEFNQRSRSRAA